jgi:serine/threonine protein kinase
MNTEHIKAAFADRYRIERQVGEGGMATVYLAFDLKHDRRVALKVLRPELAAVLGAERFIQEIKTTANLQHPHILPLFDSGRAGELLYYVMPFVEGETLGRNSPGRPSSASRNRCGSRARWPTRSTTLTATASFTVTSSPRTSCSRMAARWSPISGSRSP